MVTTRPLDPGDLNRAYEQLCLLFGEAAQPADTPVELALVDLSLFYGAYTDDGSLVGTAGAFDLSMPVPGTGPGRVAGVTWVGVESTHRRRGVVRAMMERQLTDLHDSGVAVAALWASQGAIYQRFGYGPATWQLALTVDSGAAFREPVESAGVRLVEPTGAALAPAFDAVAVRTPGYYARDARWWDSRLHDPEHARAGASPLQCAVTDGGYVLYRTTPKWEDGVPSGLLAVRELVAATEPARARLWRHVLDRDLMGVVTAERIAPDDPLLHLLAEPRLARPKLSEALWVRLVDLPAALQQRRYATDLDVVLQVQDRTCPWNSGTYRLTGGRDGAQCRPDDGAPDLVVSPEDLGAAYLGGTPLVARRAGIGEVTSGALARTSTAFGPVDVAPFCPMVF